MDVDKELLQKELISDMALEIMEEEPGRPPYAEGWRSINELVDETGKSEIIVRRVAEQKVKRGEGERVKSRPYCYRKIKR